MVIAGDDVGHRRAESAGGDERNRSSKNGSCQGGIGNSPAGDDLRNYAYEGEGSSPGSLSSCLESCSGSAKILGGFREVAQILESWDPTSPHSSHSPFRTTRTSSAKDTTPVTTIVCDIHKVNGLNGDVTTSNTYPDPLPPPIIDGLATTVLAETMSTAIPMPVPELPCAFNTK
nr:uncharacterized protein LOC123773859 [Procambarus clarkii]